MINFLIGENDFEIRREVARLVANFDGMVERPDSVELTLSDAADLFAGQTLFNDRRCVVLGQLSDNKTVWNELPKWLERLNDQTDLVLVETKPDKRTRTYKWLQQHAIVKDFPVWTNRDQAKAYTWTLEEAKRLGCELTSAQARQIVAKVGADQWRIFRALEKLCLLDEMTGQSIDDYVDTHPEENVFQLLETALRGDEAGVRRMIETLRLEADAYQTFGLLSSQMVQLTTLSVSTKSSGDVARDIGAAPFVLSRLDPYAKRLGSATTRQLLKITADTDMQMKSSGHEPWSLIETMLLKIALAV